MTQRAVRSSARATCAVFSVAMMATRLVALAILTLGACKASPITRATVDDASAVAALPSTIPAAPAPAPSASEAPKRDGEEAPLKGWSDPRLVKLLVADCAFDPTNDVDKVAAKLGVLPGRSPLESITCGGVYEQSCVPSPCDTESCRQDCGNKCDDCAKPCIASCTACKRDCADDACLGRCATRCATCRGECVASGDRCVSGTCGQQRAKCQADFDAKWKKFGCAAPCRKLGECRTQCYAERAGSTFCKACETYKPSAQCEPLCVFDATW